MNRQLVSFRSMKTSKPKVIVTMTKTYDLEEKKNVKEKDKWYHHSKLKVSVNQRRDERKG